MESQDRWGNQFRNSMSSGITQGAISEAGDVGEPSKQKKGGKVNRLRNKVANLLEEAMNRKEKLQKSESLGEEAGPEQISSIQIDEASKLEMTSDEPKDTEHWCCNWKILLIIATIVLLVLIVIGLYFTLD